MVDDFYQTSLFFPMPTVVISTLCEDGSTTLVLKGCVDWAKENGVTLVDASHMKIINDKRAKEKQKK